MYPSLFFVSCISFLWFCTVNALSLSIKENSDGVLVFLLAHSCLIQYFLAIPCVRIRRFYHTEWKPRNCSICLVSYLWSYTELDYGGVKFPPSVPYSSGEFRLLSTPPASVLFMEIWHLFIGTLYCNGSCKCSFLLNSFALGVFFHASLSFGLALQTYKVPSINMN